jgi:hypothetical protein
MRQCVVKVLAVILWLGTTPSVSAQTPRCSDLVYIDGTEQTMRTLFALTVCASPAQNSLRSERRINDASRM